MKYFTTKTLFIALIFGLWSHLSHAETAIYPRFENLKTSKANLRKGPGTEFPIEWTYQGGNIPFRILSEYNSWYRVQDIEGSKGWISKRFFNKKRSFQINSATNVAIHKAADSQSKIVAWAAHLARGEIIACEIQADWCQIQLENHKGFIQRQYLWGIMPQETIQK